MMDRKPVFDAVRSMTGGFTQTQVDALDKAIDTMTGERTERLYPTAVPVEVTAPPVTSRFALSDKSKAELLPVLPALRHCVELAITLTAVDFTVLQGLRSINEQAANVAKGVSRTMKSKHLRQQDGYCHAVDLGAIKDGKVTWDFNTYAYLAAAMDEAATKLGIAGHIRWGCAWDRVLSDFGGSPEAYLAEAKAYAHRHAGSDLLDAPHFEWVA